MQKITPIPVRDIVLKKGLLAERAEIVRTEVIPYQWEALNDRITDAEPSYAMENLRIAAGEKEGKHRGFIFQDSDVAKWLEAVGYRLATHPDPQLEKNADEVIELLGRVQEQDGYLNSYYTIMKPEERWTNLRDDHELYCAGHLIEAAVAYFEGTGKTALLEIVCKFVDHIDSIFGPEPEKMKGYPGHQEIELALVRLYGVTKDEKHLNLAKFFLDQRGQQPHYFEKEAEKRGQPHYWYTWGQEYNQSHLPVREQKKAVGHSVRAMYMYSAMVDVAKETNDHELMAASKRLWESTVQQRMYITGGLGSQEFGEGFSSDYDLPNDTAYTETCAAIGLVFWAHRMLQVEANSDYADVLERALYNGVSSGMSLDGKRFFYVNPLEVAPQVSKRRRDHFHVRTTRQGWFGCACCPPNIARLFTSIGQYLYGVENESLYVHLFAHSTATLKIKDCDVELKQTTNYPHDGSVKFTINPKQSQKFSLNIRIPGWCTDWSVKVNGQPLEREKLDKGYLEIARIWEYNDTVEVELSMEVKRVRANPFVRENAGKIALQRGPLVYCLEECDNGKNLSAISLPKEAQLRAKSDPELKMPVVIGKALMDTLEASQLYTCSDLVRKEVDIRAVPYFAWDNRETGEMLVWIRES